MLPAQLLLSDEEVGLPPAAPGLLRPVAELRVLPDVPDTLHVATYTVLACVQEFAPLIQVTMSNDSDRFSFLERTVRFGVVGWATSFTEGGLLLSRLPLCSDSQEKDKQDQYHGEKLTGAPNRQLCQDLASTQLSQC